ncbi:MAG: outer membrane protein assembly factor [Idiomarina sp.]|nr:outer membrane protein assembly factor [Idiomarina sp.]
MRVRVLILLYALLSGVSYANDEPARVFVTIEGLNGRELTNVRNLLSIYDYHNRNAPGDSRVRYLHGLANREFRRALSPFGYYQYTLDSELTQGNDNHWYAVYRVNLGQAVPIRSVNVQILGAGGDDERFAEVRRRLPLSTGASLRHANYETAKSMLRRVAAERGYYQARFSTQELRIDLDDYAADIILIMETGPRYRFGEVRITEGHLDDDVMRRFIGFQEGDFVSASELLELQLGLSDSDYFSRIEVQPLWGEATDQFEVPVSVEYEPNTRIFDQWGIGYGTDTGARASFQENRRWINRRGHRWNGQLQASEIRTSVGTSYIIPGRRPQTDQYVFRALWTEETIANVNSERVTLGFSWQTQLTRTQRIIALDWQQERDRLDGERRDTQYLIPSAQWTRVHAEDRLNVSDGFRLAFTVRGASNALLSDSDFVQGIMAGKYVKRFSPRTRFLTRAEVGTSVTGNFDQVPTSLRFFAGGDRSIRGYGYRSISPRDSQGEAAGGRHLVVGSIETDYEFRANWRVAAFVDSGNAFNEIDEPFRTGAGIGFRWQSPVGPIRFDLAHGFSTPGDTIRLHLNIGPDL